VFSATILRPLTYARNYANLRPRKSNVRMVRTKHRDRQNTIRQYTRKITRERKSGSSPKRFSGRLRFALAFRLALLFVAACACLGEAQPSPLVQTSTCHGATSVFPLFSAPFLSCVQSEFLHNKTAPCGAALR